MKDELDKQLCEKYPKIFRDRNAHMSQTAMCWGLAVGDGWFNIIDSTCHLIQSHIDHTRSRRANALRFNRALKQELAGNEGAMGRYFLRRSNKQILSQWDRDAITKAIATKGFEEVPDACPQLVAVQVKEKFGTLRFYYNGGDKYCFGVANMAEAMSETTCEECGNVGEMRNTGWISVRCDKHVKAPR